MEVLNSERSDVLFQCCFPSVNRGPPAGISSKSVYSPHPKVSHIPLSLLQKTGNQKSGKQSLVILNKFSGMDNSSQFSDPYALTSNSLSMNWQETSAVSDGSTSCRVVHSDEEVLLATSCPKKKAGRRIFKETRHPVFRGVRKRNSNKWVCEMREPNKKTRIWLGTYHTPEMAARAHDVAALALRGKSACLNFADSAWRLPVPVSKDAKDIRRAANEAAELSRPQDLGGNDVSGQTGNTGKDYSSEVCNDDKSNLQENVFYEEAVLDMTCLRCLWTWQKAFYSLLRVM